jgi:Spy/CpxP family protein refolding chaperone
MKMNAFKSVGLISGLALALMTGSLQAQHGYGMHRSHGSRPDSGTRAHMVPDLTVDQEKKISELRTSHQKEMTNYRNDLAIKQAELQKYKTAEKPDMALINKTIDEIGKLSTDMHKKRVSHELAVRNLLTDEQKAAFDARRTLGGTGRNYGNWGKEHPRM